MLPIRNLGHRKYYKEKDKKYHLIQNSKSLISNDSAENDAKIPDNISQSSILSRIFSINYDDSQNSNI